MAKKNTGKTYEELVRDVYQALVNYDNPKLGYKTIEVKHNVIIEGKSGTSHQIDVYWEFVFAGVVYKTIVEVKDWKSKVKQEQIHSLHSVINDIQGCSKGIFVSKNGFQSGAITYANKHGISLIQLDDNNVQQFARIANTITHYKDGALMVDQEWVKNIPILDKSEDCHFPCSDYNEIILIDPEGKEITAFDLFCQAAIPFYYNPAGIEQKVSKKLKGDWYLKTKNNEFPLIKIGEYRFVCYNTVDFLDIEVKDFCEYILVDILSETNIRYCSKDKTVHTEFMRYMIETSIKEAISICSPEAEIRIYDKPEGPFDT